MPSLTVAIATLNEEANIGDCLKSVKSIADEIIIVDGASADNTVKIASAFTKNILITKNYENFHVNKQKALDLSTSDWILQLDADERVSKELGDEIIKVIRMSDTEIEKYELNLPNRKLFLRHQLLLQARDGKIGTDENNYNAFFLPRKNYFLGKFLRYGGVYPDGVIRLVRRGKAYFPVKDVHEQIVVQGKVGWLRNDLLHLDSPDFSKYLFRWKRYVRFEAKLIQGQKKYNNIILAILYLFVYPLWWFIKTYVRHKGFIDGWQGFVFSFFSALRFPSAYLVNVFRRT